MVCEFTGQVIEWRGPAPFLFVPLPDDLAADIKAMSSLVTYGWGVIPAVVQIGGTEFKTSLFPRNGTYLVPIKVIVQKAESIRVNDTIAVHLEVG